MTIYVIDVPHANYRPVAPVLRPEPGNLLHVALGLAVVVFALLAGLVAHSSAGVPAVFCDTMTLVAAVYALGLIVFCETRLSLNLGAVRI